MDLVNQIKLLKEMGFGSKTIARDPGVSKNWGILTLLLLHIEILQLTGVDWLLQ